MPKPLDRTKIESTSTHASQVSIVKTDPTNTKYSVLSSERTRTAASSTQGVAIIAPFKKSGESFGTWGSCKTAAQSQDSPLVGQLAGTTASLGQRALRQAELRPLDFARRGPFMASTPRRSFARGGVGIRSQASTECSGSPSGWSVPEIVGPNCGGVRSEEASRAGTTPESSPERRLQDL